MSVQETGTTRHFNKKGIKNNEFSANKMEKETEITFKGHTLILQKSVVKTAFQCSLPRQLLTHNFHLRIPSKSNQRQLSDTI